MTIYNLEVKPDMLSKLPTTYHVMVLCEHISFHFLAFFRNNLFKDQPSIREEMLSEVTFLRWHIRYYLKPIPVPTGYCPKVRIIRIFIAKQATRFDPGLRYEFHLDTLHSVPPKVLLEALAMLLNSSLACIQSVIPSTSRTNLISSMETIRTIPDTISAYAHMEDNVRPNGTRMYLKVELDDQQHEQRYLL